MHWASRDQAEPERTEKLPRMTGQMLQVKSAGGTLEHHLAGLQAYPIAHHLIETPASLDGTGAIWLQSLKGFPPNLHWHFLHSHDPQLWTEAKSPEVNEIGRPAWPGSDEQPVREDSMLDLIWGAAKQAGYPAWPDTRNEQPDWPSRCEEQPIRQNS